MALTATIYNVHVDLADMDRGVYESLDLRLARHPSETVEFMVVRVLAYCLEYREGIAFTEGLSSGDEPAIVVRDLTGQLQAWIEVGIPDASRLHRASKQADRVAVYTHRNAHQLLQQLSGQRIHKADTIPIRALDRHAVERVAALLDRRAAFTLSMSDGSLTVSFDHETIEVPLVEHHLSEK